MTQKKPIWATTEAHAHLKAYCNGSGRTQLEVVSELILTQLDLSRAGEAADAQATDSTPKDDAERGEAKGDGRHFGGVWVV